MKHKRYSKNDNLSINRFHLAILFIIVFIAINLRQLFSHQNHIKICSTTMSSTCSGLAVTKWNTKAVEQRLKEWINSLTFTISEHEMESKNKCIEFFITKNEYFHNYGTDAISDKVMLFGRVLRKDHFKLMNKVTFQGPVWADLNNPAGWDIIKDSRGVLRVKKKNNLRNGLYYGHLNNQYMKIGNKKFTLTLRNNNFMV